MPRGPGGPPQVMHNDPRGPRPDWNRPPGKFQSFNSVTIRCRLKSSLKREMQTILSHGTFLPSRTVFIMLSV